MKIIRNSAHCNKCDTDIESKHRHDFVSCKCGDISVDGGKVYFRRAINENADWTDTSISVESIEEITGKENAPVHGGVPRR